MIPNNQFFYNNGKQTLVLPSALLLTWWTSLAVKPSNALMTSLNALVDGLNADGNWAKLDFFELIAGMETNEQRLRPLITTSGDDVLIVGAPIINANGVRNNAAAGYLNLKWNPTDNGIQYTNNSAFISTYVGSAIAPFGSIAAFMGWANQYTADANSYLSFDDNGNNVSGVLNYDGTSMAFPGIINVTSVYYHAFEVNSGNSKVYKNLDIDTFGFNGPGILPTSDLYGADMSYEDGSPYGSYDDAILRHFMAGSGTANQTTILARLNTFYTSRGL